MAYENRDYTHLSAEEKQKIESIAQAIRNKAYGIDVRESIALAIEWVNKEYKTTIANNKLTLREFENAKSKVSNLELDMDEFIQRYSEQVAGNTTLDETIDARVDATGVSHTTLKDRLDKEQQEVTAQLAQTGKISGKNKFDTRGVFRGYDTSKGMITIIDDDIPQEVYTKLKPIAEEYNIPITCAVVTSVVGKNAPTNGDMYPGKPALTLDQMRELQEIGFEFVSHTHSHARLNTLSSEQIREEFEKSRKWLWENGFDGSTAMVYPYGAFNQTVLDEVDKYYESGFNIDHGESIVLKAPLKRPFDIKRVATNNLSKVKRFIDEVADNGGWVVPLTHVWFDDWSEIEFREMIEYALARGLEFVSVREGLKRFSDGTSPSDTVLSLNSLPVTVNTPISEFPDNKITYRRMRASELVGFPNGAGGMLVTHKLSDDWYTWKQTLFISPPLYNDRDVRYERQVISSDGEWGEFRQFEELPTLGNPDIVTIDRNGWTGSFTVQKDHNNNVSLVGKIVVGTVSEASILGQLPENVRPYRLTAIQLLRQRQSSTVVDMVGGYISDSGNVVVLENAYGKYAIKMGDILQFNLSYKDE